ncbi:MAG: hypothetical protein OXF31_00910, partial [Gammaproteobacteria bacterium]|nr:hypothetical protein [Gammaproteobacteria bacterium]
PDQRTHKRPDARRGPQGISGVLPRVATEPSAKNVDGRLWARPSGGCGQSPCGGIEFSLV